MESINKRYTWVQTHKELVEYLAGKENEQKELIELLKDSGVEKGLVDEYPEGNRIELEEIDPFSFFCFIYKFGPRKRLEILQKIAKRLGLHYPEDEKGIPSAQAQKVMMFLFKHERSNEIDLLWEFFFSALNDSITDKQFQDILQLYGVGIIKITEVLFYIDPDKYLPINGPSKPYLKEVLGIDPDFNTWEEYLNILKQVKNVTDRPFYQISYEAWVWSEKQKEREDELGMTKWKELFDVIRKIDDEAAVRKFFRSAAYVFSELGVDSGRDDQKVYTSALKNYIQVTVGGRYVVMVERKKNRSLLGFYAKNESLDRIRKKYPQINLEKGTDDNDTNRTWVKIAAEKADEEDFFDGIMALAREGYEGQEKSQFRSRYPDKHNPWIIRAALDESVLDNLFAKYFVVGGKWGDTDKTDEFVANGIWENGHERKFTEEVKDVAAGSFIAIKAPYTREKTKSVMLIKARGRVTHNPKNGRQLHIKWEAGFDPFEVGFSGGYRSTIHEVTKADHIVSIWFNGNINEERNAATDTHSDTKRTAMNYPLNTIFYGPPGTGKTYNTIRRAAEIVEGRTIDHFDEAKRIFNEQLGDTIEFITFHQNYSYEDFIQGLRPETEGSDSLVFEKKDGVFKRLADRAHRNLIDSRKNRHQLNKSLAFSSALESLKDEIMESDEPVRINETAYFVAVEEDAFRYSADNWTLKGKGFTGFRMKYSDLIEFFEDGIETRKEIKELNNVSGLSKQHASYFFKTYEIIKDRMNLSEVQDADTEKKNYVLIIDEINRANISRVFGELITLIEPDKRSDGDIPLKTRLPSGDPFIVPSNLYLIGTMNTADKSIAQLDIALRRRFEFEAMYPDYEINEIQDADILKKINKKIIEMKGHDFQIGHSYFMDNGLSLKDRMNRKVIPLLMEYFMNEKKEVQEVLKSAGLEIEENSWPIRILGEKA